MNICIDTEHMQAYTPDGKYVFNLSMYYRNRVHKAMAMHYQDDREQALREIEEELENELIETDAD